MRALFRTAVPILLLAAFTARAVEIDVNGRAIEIPLPPGYSELTPEMSPVYEAMYSYVVPSNERYLIIMPTEITESILRGEDAVYERYMVVESERQTARQSFSTQTFAEFRDILRSQLDEIFEEVRQELPDLADDASQSVSDAIGEDLELSIGEIVPFAVHLDTENAMAYSQYVNYGTAVAGEDMGNTVVAATTAFVHVRDKILFIYVYGAEDDLEWSRDFASNWLDQIFAANTATAASGGMPVLTRGAVLEPLDDTAAVPEPPFDEPPHPMLIVVAIVIGLLVLVLLVRLFRKSRSG